MKLKERLKEMIESKGVTPYEIYIKTGVYQSTLSRILTGKTDKLNIRNSELLAEYFGVNTLWLKTGEGEKYNIGAKPDVLTQISSDKGGDDKTIRIGMLQERIDELNKRVEDLTRENAVQRYLIERDKLQHSEN